MDIKQEQRALREIFAANLQALMEQRGLRIADLAAALGLSYTTVADWVHGRKYPRMDKVQALADYFGVLKSDLTEVKFPLAARVAALCEAKGITPARLFAMLGLQHEYTAFMRGGGLTLVAAKRIADHFGMPVDELADQPGFWQQAMAAYGPLYPEVDSQAGQSAEAAAFVSGLLAAYGEEPAGFTADDIRDIAQFMHMLHRRAKPDA